MFGNSGTRDPPQSLTSMLDVMRWGCVTLSVGLLFGCAPKGSGPAYTEEDVRKFVTAGKPREDIIARFGEPVVDQRDPKFEDGNTNIDEILFFVLPDPNPLTNERWVFSGFEARLHAGRAVDWAASHRSVHVGRSPSSHPTSRGTE